MLEYIILHSSLRQTLVSSILTSAHSEQGIEASLSSQPPLSTLLSFRFEEELKFSGSDTSSKRLFVVPATHFLLCRGCRQFREAVRRDLEDERVRFEAVRKRARVAAAKEIETVRAAEADRAGITLAENARELREVGSTHYHSLYA